MTGEELQAIRDNRDRLAADRYSAMVIDEYIRHVDALVTEVERMREIVQAVADMDVILEDGDGFEECVFHCDVSNSRLAHALDCPYRKARAILYK